MGIMLCVRYVSDKVSWKGQPSHQSLHTVAPENEAGVNTKFDARSAESHLGTLRISLKRIMEYLWKIHENPI